MRVTRLIPIAIALLGLAAAPAASASGGTPVAPPSTTGGAGVGAPPVTPSTPAQPTVPGFTAKIVRGVAYAPAYAPLAVQEAIWAGNRIRHKPYVFGGGHAAFIAAGYDCSGSVSYVLHAGGLLSSPLDSSDFMRWGQKGLGHWITVYTNPGHAFVEIAGIRLDTSAEGDPHPAKGSGPRWRPTMRSIRGFMERHPVGL